MSQPATKIGEFYYLWEKHPDLQDNFPLFVINLGNRIAEVIEANPRAIKDWEFRHRGITLLRTELRLHPAENHWRRTADPDFWARTIHSFKTTYGRKCYQRITGLKINQGEAFIQGSLF